MSRFFSPRHSALVPYTPGEQPKERILIKLNTNESPYPPSQAAQQTAQQALSSLMLYSDPTCATLHGALAQRYGVRPNQVLCTHGSDEILNFAFMAFCDANVGAAFANITYGFYRVFAQLHNIPYTEIPLQADFSIRCEDYYGLGKTIFIANPNAPTGIALSVSQIERILQQNPDNVVVVDEAYVDFGAQSCVPLIHTYPNLLVTQTFSKSRSMAGARLGFGIGCEALIADLKTIQYSTNPYNVNAVTQAAGIGALCDEDYTRKNCQSIMENRAWTHQKLEQLGFCVLPSQTNFLFARHPKRSGKDIYCALRREGILVRHFDTPLLGEYNRITIGSRTQMEALLRALTAILEESV